MKTNTCKDQIHSTLLLKQKSIFQVCWSFIILTTVLHTCPVLLDNVPMLYSSLSPGGSTWIVIFSAVRRSCFSFFWPAHVLDQGGPLPLGFLMVQINWLPKIGILGGTFVASITPRHRGHTWGSWCLNTWGLQQNTLTPPKIAHWQLQFLARHIIVPLALSRPFHYRHLCLPFFKFLTAKSCPVLTFLCWQS